MFNDVSNGNGAHRNADARLQQVKMDLHERLIAGIDLSIAGELDRDELQDQLRRGAQALCSNWHDLLSQDERETLIEEVIEEALGWGPLEPLLRDPTVSDILINGPDTVYVERRGRLESTNVSFRDEQHLLDVVQRIASNVGRRIDESTPMVDARLPNGSRVNAVIRPVALKGALVSIRQFSHRPLLAGDLVGRRAATPEMVDFLASCVRARMSIMVSGGTGSGKTTLLNVLSGYIPEDERIATIEDAAELQLQQPHVAGMETRPANLEGRGEITARDLVRNALRMRPDRIIVGECRGPEAFDMLQAMSTGHHGSMTTIHSNDARDAISRLEMLVGMAGFDLPLWFIHRQIASAVQIVVQVARLSGGARKIVQISEITGCEGGTIAMHDVFTFEQTGVDAQRAAEGYFQATGIIPQCLDHMKAAGERLPIEMFEQQRLEFDRLKELQYGCNAK